MFYECEDIENYADDTTPNACASYINAVISELQITAGITNNRQTTDMWFLWLDVFLFLNIILNYNWIIDINYITFAICFYTVG